MNDVSSGGTVADGHPLAILEHLFHVGVGEHLRLGGGDELSVLAHLDVNAIDGFPESVDAPLLLFHCCLGIFELGAESLELTGDSSDRLIDAVELMLDIFELSHAYTSLMLSLSA